MTNIVFLRDPHYMTKVREVYGAQIQHCRLAFFDHNHNEVTQLIHAFPVPKESVRQFIERYRHLEKWGRREFRFKRVSRPDSWLTYALSWQKMDNFVGGNSIVPPQVLRFQANIHSNKEGWEHFRLVCGCCSGEEWGIPLEYQVIFSPHPIAYTRKARIT